MHRKVKTNTSKKRRFFCSLANLLFAMQKKDFESFHAVFFMLTSIICACMLYRIFFFPRLISVSLVFEWSRAQTLHTQSDLLLDRNPVLYKFVFEYHTDFNVYINWDATLYWHEIFRMGSQVKTLCFCIGVFFLQI